MAIVQLRVDDELKAQASSVYEKLGLDLSSAIRMFLKRSVMVNGIPFPMIISDAQKVVVDLQNRSLENGNADMTLDDINKEIARARNNRKKQKQQYLHKK